MMTKIHAAPIKLSVKRAMKIALRKSFDLKDIDFDKKLAELAYQSGVAELFLPRVYLNANHSTNKNISRLKGKEDDDFVVGDALGRNKQSEISLTVENINILNSGRDLITKKIFKLTKKRAFENLEIQKKQFLYNVYREYFNLRAAKERLDAANIAIKTTKSFLELSKTLPVSRREDVFAAKSELNLAIKQQIATYRDYKTQLFTFNLLLNNSLDKEYDLISPFPTIKTDLKNINLQKLVVGSIEYRNNQKDLAIAKKSRTLINRQIQPYINLNVSGARYGSQWVNDSDHQRLFESTPEGSNFINASLSVGINIPIWGAEGFMASYDRTRAKVEVLKLKNNKRRLLKQQQLRLLSASINLDFIKKDLIELDQLINNQARTLEVIMKRYEKGAANAVEIREAISSFTFSILESYDRKISQIDTIIEILNSFDFDNEISKVVKAVVSAKSFRRKDY